MVNLCQLSVLSGGRVFSADFCVNCGVRQGGILSPLLFNVCVDELSDPLSDSGLAVILAVNFSAALCMQMIQLCCLLR